MSELWLPNQHRRPVQMTEKLAVIVHRKTKRILCFCFEDAFARTFESKGYEVIPLHYAHEYDKYAKQFREQTNIENQAEDAAYLEREDRARQQLRGDLKRRLSLATDGATRKAIESALHTLDIMQERKKRYRAESFLVQEGYEEGKTDGEAIARKIICNE